LDSKIIQKTRYSEAFGLGFALKAVGISYSEGLSRRFQQHYPVKAPLSDGYEFWFVIIIESGYCALFSPSVNMVVKRYLRKQFFRQVTPWINITY
jgi:hypothetical protein